jgi:CRISPR-associated endonuclease/helicase Cas3
MMGGTAATAPVSSLTEGDFAAFFQEVHGWAPFPWQRALLHRVLEPGWPALIDVPTGLGKTAVLDVAVFASALRSELARRRVFLVVDRRLIVDQADEHAGRIQQALAGAGPGSVCQDVARQLAADGDDGPVLDVTRMRGGISWSWLWLERPDRHAIVTGTVDQVGSRLLFRGYGVGERLRPIDAALTGTGSLIIVDEAHLSDAFLSTLRDIQEHETSRTAPTPVVVAMSASPGTPRADTHSVTSADQQDPIAAQRLAAAKRLHLLTVPAAKDAAAGAVADALAYWALRLGGPGRVTGVVANTVARARAVFGKLQQELGDRAGLVLLTGRVRPVDRDYLLHDWYPRIRSGTAHQDGQPLYVVATQTIEVGADIDLDMLVTESASLPALTQRLGRLNRRGERPAATAVAVHADKLNDGVYAEARPQTWQWLASLTDPVQHRHGSTAADLGPGIDASPQALRHRAGGLPSGQREAMRGPRPYAPLVSAVTLDTWARTSPTPRPDVPVAPYLHGIGASEPTVSVIWRADTRGEDPAQWRNSADRIPPSADEAIELPISAVRHWLAIRPGTLTPAGRTAADSDTDDAEALSDTESQAPPSPAAHASLAVPPGEGAGRRVLRYRGADDCEPITPRQIGPGDLLIVPAGWGGCDRYGWNPASHDPVIDVADLTGARGRCATVARIGHVLCDAIRFVAPDLSAAIDQFTSQVITDLGNDAPDNSVYRAMLTQMLSAPHTGTRNAGLPHERVLRRLASAGQITALEGPAAGDGVTALFAAPGTSWNDDTSPAGTSVSGDAQPMTLTAHQAAVQHRAGQFARNLGLPDPIISAVMLAAAHHDEGKRDPRFQLMLHGGDRWRAMAAAEALAKSGMDPADRAAFRRAQLLSGYPAGMRHEALSARAAALRLAPGADGPAPSGVDPDLVIHLISSHHGYGRPLLPPTTDPAPVTVEFTLNGGRHTSLDTAATVDWDGPRRFAGLCDQHGRWGLALLETIVRLADIWCSARSEQAP